MGTRAASYFPVWFVVDLTVVVAVFGAWMERMVVFFCREKGLGVSRGLGARVGLEAHPVWEVSTELSITEWQKEKEKGDVHVKQSTYQH